MSQITLSNPVAALEAANDPEEPGSSMRSDPDHERSDSDEPPASPHTADDSSNRVQFESVCALGQKLDLAWLNAHLFQAIELIDHDINRVSIRLVDDQEMRELHLRYRNDDSTTDVLTFPTCEPGEPIDTDLVICVEQAMRQATIMQHSIEREVLLYALHGILHCAGFNDHDETDFQLMHKEEDRILASIGVGATFKRRNSSHDDTGATLLRDRESQG